MARVLRARPTVDPDSIDEWRAMAQSRTISAESSKSGQWLMDAAVENFKFPNLRGHEWRQMAKTSPLFDLGFLLLWV